MAYDSKKKLCEIFFAFEIQWSNKILCGVPRTFMLIGSLLTTMQINSAKYDKLREVTV